MVPGGDAGGVTATARDRSRVAADTRRWAQLAVLLAAVFLVIADVFVTTVAAPGIRADLSATDTHLQLTLALYNISYGGLLLGGGRLGDRFGRRRLFRAGVAVFLAASVWCATAASAEMLVVGRLAQGVGPALLMPQVFALIQERFQGRDRAVAFGLFSAVSGVAAASAQVWGGALIDADLFGLGWRGVFWVNVAPCLVVLVAAGRLAPDRPVPTVARFDWLGLGLTVTALVAAVTGFAVAVSDPVLATVAVAVAVASGARALGRNRSAAAHGRDPVVDPALLARSRFRRYLAAAAGYYAGNAVLFVLLPLWATEVRGFSVTAAGLLFAPLATAFAVSSGLATRRFGTRPRRLLRAGLAGLLAGYLGLGLVLATAGGTTVPVVVVLVAIGVAMGAVAAPLNTLATAHVAPPQTGAASGLLTTALELGYGMGAALGVGCYSLLLSSGLPGGAAFAWSVAAPWLLTAAVAALVRDPRTGPGRGSAPPRPARGEVAAAGWRSRQRS